MEFIFAGLLLLAPLVYLIVALGDLQHQSLGVETGARHIARAIATAERPEQADDRVREVLATVAAEYGIDPGSLSLEVTCAERGAPCPHAGTTLTVTLSTRVALPLAPPLLGLDRLASVPVEATAVQTVSRFWGSR